MKRLISVTINGKQRTDEVEPRLLLIHYLRELSDSPAPTSAARPPLRRLHRRTGWQGRQIVHACLRSRRTGATC